MAQTYHYNFLNSLMYQEEHTSQNQNEGCAGAGAGEEGAEQQPRYATSGGSRPVTHCRRLRGGHRSYFYCKH